MSEGMEHCNLTLITVEGCGACKKLKNTILRDAEVDDWGIDVLHIDNVEKHEVANQRFPGIDSVPSLVIECGNEKSQSITGLDNIKRFVNNGLF